GQLSWAKAPGRAPFGKRGSRGNGSGQRGVKNPSWGTTKWEARDAPGYGDPGPHPGAGGPGVGDSWGGTWGAGLPLGGPGAGAPTPRTRERGPIPQGAQGTWGGKTGGPGKEDWVADKGWSPQRPDPRMFRWL
ncbi:hypothetical protein CRENBAI_001310, partial [Crenichthys baileyi]